MSGGEGKGGERKEGEEGKERGGEDPLDLLPRKNFLATPLHSIVHTIVDDTFSFW